MVVGELILEVVVLICHTFWGHEIGQEDDLHPTFETKISTDSWIIWDIIHNVFASNDKYRHIVKLHDGHGYEALKSIFCKLHPLLIESLSMLVVTTWPTQGSLSLMEYWKKYNHYIMLHALIEGNKQTVYNWNERKHFVNGYTHSSFLQTEIRQEQDFDHLKHRFEPSNFIATLQQYLNFPNSPTQV